MALAIMSRNEKSLGRMQCNMAETPVSSHVWRDPTQSSDFEGRRFCHSLGGIQGALRALTHWGLRWRHYKGSKEHCNLQEHNPPYGSLDNFLNSA